MTEPHDWPFEQPARGTLRPWYLTATGYLAVLFSDSQEAQRAQRGLLEWGMPENDIRLYQAEEILSIASRQQQERSTLAKTIAALVTDREARQRYLGNAQAGGSVASQERCKSTDAGPSVSAFGEADQAAESLS
jgi:hypothetical protein